MNAQHSTASAEHFTPGEFVRSARKVMGGIDVDPASCEVANKTIGAARYYTKETNGFNRSWGGRVFLNPLGGICDHLGRVVIRETPKRKGCSATGECGLPPGHEHKGVTSSAKAWWFQLAKQYVEGHAECGLYVGFSVEILQTTQIDPPKDLPIPFDFQLCFPKKRLRFWIEKNGILTPGKSPTHSSVLIFIPPRWRTETSFRDEFSQYGRVIG